MTTKRSGRARRIAMIGFALAALGVLSACSNVGPQDYLNPEGPNARTAHKLFLPTFAIATFIFVLVEGAIFYAVWKFRQNKNANEPVQVHGNTKLEIGWTIAPAVILAALAVPTVATIFSLAEVPAKADNPINVKVIGHQWWWEYQYDTEPQVKTATELVIPINRKVYLTITSADVIHAFWVPKLAGKQDAIPNRDSFITLEAETPGTYHGQCAEFCALSHANMRLRVVAMTQGDYDKWLAGQKRDAQIPTSGLAAEGAKIFQEFSTKAGSCIGCHVLRGIPGAEGQVGPDLTHFASRGTFAGAIFDTNEKNLHAWLDDPPAVKPGSLMPDYGLSQDAIRALVAFLLSLE